MTLPSYIISRNTSTVAKFCQISVSKTTLTALSKKIFVGFYSLA